MGIRECGHSSGRQSCPISVPDLRRRPERGGGPPPRDASPSNCLPPSPHAPLRHGSPAPEAGQPHRAFRPIRTPGPCTGPGEAAGLRRVTPRQTTASRHHPTPRPRRSPRTGAECSSTGANPWIISIQTAQPPPGRRQTTGRRKSERDPGMCRRMDPGLHGTALPSRACSVACGTSAVGPAFGPGMVWPVAPPGSAV
jgi:hypothetical protein